MASFLNQIFGSKPSVPGLPTYTLGQAQSGAIAENLQALPQAESLVSQANLFSQDQITAMLNAAIPGYSGMQAAAGQNIESMLKGEIPQDVSAAIQNSAAARSLGLGIGGSGASKNLVARDLGLTSLDLTQRGLSSMENWMRTSASIYEPNMMNVASMFVSPMQQYQTQNEQNIQQFQRNWMANQVAAMPDPVMRGIHDTIMSLADAYLGGSYSEGFKPGDYGKTSGGVGGGGGGAGIDTGTADTGMYGSPSGPEGGASGFGGTEGDFGAGFGGGGMGLA